ncbi:ferritin-like domain-containing protein [Streptomyces roseolilacinus]|uniref:ferritin-like domain-containing protein n=1 Tax=Streptomyces roseolilacinus TaxID=66904 RepID=UPI00381318D8
MTTVFDSRSDRIVRLLHEPAEHRGADWLKDALQQAVMLELSTLPPYLCGLWSIEDPLADERVAGAIRRIVFDEMSHLGLAGNLLTTIGGTPRLADARVVPSYPCPLPGGVRPELTVYLSGLTKDSLDLYACIEEPDQPLARAAAHTSIGAFYTAVLEAFREHPDLITGGHQLTRPMAHHGQGNSVVPLTSLADVEAAIGVIKEQGEGTSASPENPHPEESGELAHFYVFREIFHGHALVRTAENPDRWEFTGAEIPMPRAFPMGVVPAGGWAGDLAPDPATREELDAVDHAYSRMLHLLEKAWQADTPAVAKNLLGQAVRQMGFLEEPARALMQRPLPDGSGRTYGPQFLYRDDA